MTAPAEKLLIVRRWIAKAEDDFAVAERLSAAGAEGPDWVVCFHAQQSAEKYIKALLVWMQISFGKVHDLEEVFELLPAGQRPLVSRLELSKLSGFAVAGRYPDADAETTRADARQALAVAGRVRDGVRELLPPEVREPDR